MGIVAHEPLCNLNPVNYRAVRESQRNPTRCYARSGRIGSRIGKASGRPTRGSPRSNSGRLSAPRARPTIGAATGPSRSRWGAVRQRVAGTKTQFPPKYRRSTKIQSFSKPGRKEMQVRKSVQTVDRRGRESPARVFRPAKVFKEAYTKHRCVEAWKNYDRKQTQAAILQASLVENAILEATREHTMSLQEAPAMEYVQRKRSRNISSNYQTTIKEIRTIGNTIVNSIHDLSKRLKKGSNKLFANTLVN